MGSITSFACLLAIHATSSLPLLVEFEAYVQHGRSTGFSSELFVLHHQYLDL